MKKNIIIKSLVNGILAFVLVVLIQHLVKGVALAQAVIAPYTIYLTISAIIGSFVGFSMRHEKAMK